MIQVFQLHPLAVMVTLSNSKFRVIDGLECILTQFVHLNIATVQNSEFMLFLLNYIICVSYLKKTQLVLEICFLFFFKYSY